MQHWLTTILIFLPVAGALVVALAPLPGVLARLARGARLAGRGRLLDHRGGEVRLRRRRPCSSRSTTRGSAICDVSYHVGQYAFSLWLVGMTVVVMAACTIYGWWVSRERARAYFALMLLTTGAIVGVFTAQDLLLFYAFFEAMLIPLYVLIGVWGGPNRMRATLTFVIYTVVGSLLMLAAIIVYGLQQGTFDLTRDGAEQLDVALPRLRHRVRDQVAALPVPRLAADHVPRVAARGVGGAVGRRLEGGSLRPAADRDREVPDGRRRLARRAARPRGDLARLRLAARVPRARLPRRRPVLVARAVRADRARACLPTTTSASTARCCRWSTTA